MRIVAATSRDLAAAVRVGRFRSDLYLWINVVRIDIPPLRSRPEDIQALVHALLARASRRGRTVNVTDEAMSWLCNHDWKGNVRELVNLVERALALSEHQAIGIEDVRDHCAAALMQDSITLAQAAARQLPLAQIELAYIREVIASLGGNMQQSARVLGIDRRTLYRKLGERG